MKILVSLISHQTIPNLLFIREFGEDTDKIVFITTDKFLQPDENRGEWIAEAAGIPLKKIDTILVKPNSLTDVENKLLDYPFPGTECIVNITGGTKIMAIAALSFFSELNNATVVYIPIGENSYRQLFPRKQNKKKSKGFRCIVFSA